MNTCAIPILYSGRKQGLSHPFLLALCFGAAMALAQSHIEKKLIPLFLTLESAESDAKSVQLAMRQILAMGSEVIPLVQKRFEETGNYRYLYLLEKLPKPEKPADGDSQWTKEIYFQKRFEEAGEHLRNGETAKARKIAEAILTLEPNIAFREDLRSLIRECEDVDFSQTVVSGQISTPTPFSSPGRPISITLMLTNLKQVPVALSGSGIVLEIQRQDYELAGTCQEQNSVQALALSGEITLASLQTQETYFSLPNPDSLVPMYRVFKLKARLPRCKVTYSGQKLYPAILFPETTIISFPSDFHYIRETPFHICESALLLGFPEHLFFASFFLNKNEQAQIVPRLIEALGQRPAMDAVVLGILRRFTGKNFSDKTQWQNWWYAHGSLWVEEQENQ